jgi:DNA adenine methylase
MILVRTGNKKQIAEKIYKYWPKHKLRIDLFFGAGGAYFNLPKSQYHVLNDLDDDVTNLYLVIKERSEDLRSEIERLPISATLLQHWKKNQESDPVLKAVRFLLISNFSYLGKGDTLRMEPGRTKEKLLSRINPTLKELGEARISNLDFRDVLKTIHFSDKFIDRQDAFIYLDPVYLDTSNIYKVPTWKEQDSFDCFEIMSNSGIKSAMSEFEHPFILSEAKKRGFKVIPIQNRRNINNRRNEILITNYRPQSLLF